MIQVHWETVDTPSPSHIHEPINISLWRVVDLWYYKYTEKQMIPCRSQGLQVSEVPGTLQLQIQHIDEDLPTANICAKIQDISIDIYKAYCDKNAFQ